MIFFLTPILHALWLIITPFLPVLCRHGVLSMGRGLYYVPWNIFRNSSANSGSKLWNSVPQNIKSCNSVQQYKDVYLQWIRNILFACIIVYMFT